MTKQFREWKYGVYVIYFGSAIFLAIAIWQQVQTDYVSPLIGVDLVMLVVAGFAHGMLYVMMVMDDRIKKLEHLLESGRST